MARNGHIRCSDAERDRIAEHLRDHAAEGRLTPDELADRVGLAYRAVTMRDLDRLTDDLPGSALSTGRSGRPAVVVGASVAALAVLLPWSLWALWLVGAVLVVALGVTVLALGVALAPFVLAAAAAVYALRRLGGGGRRLRPR
jgi:Domain of unknown function (DUF1707)